MDNKIHSVNKSVAEALKKELRLQGHHLTGALEASIQEYEVNEGGNIILTADAAAYIESLEKGISPADIVINSQSLAEMTRYVELRMGYKGGKAAKVAYQILQKQQLEGNPTRNSYNYSQTDERTEVIKHAFQRNNDFTSPLDTAIIGNLDEQFTKTKSGTI